MLKCIYRWRRRQFDRCAIIIRQFRIEIVVTNRALLFSSSIYTLDAERGVSELVQHLLCLSKLVPPDDYCNLLHNTASPVLMVYAASTGLTNILPSPTNPVFALSLIMLIT